MDDYRLRQTAIARHVPYTTTLSAAKAACDAIVSLRAHGAEVRSLQEWHALLAKAREEEVTEGSTAGVVESSPR